MGPIGPDFLELYFQGIAGFCALNVNWACLWVAARPYELAVGVPAARVDGCSNHRVPARDVQRRLVRAYGRIVGGWREIVFHDVPI